MQGYIHWTHWTLASSKGPIQPRRRTRKPSEWKLLPNALCCQIAWTLSTSSLISSRFLEPVPCTAWCHSKVPNVKCTVMALHRSRNGIERMEWNDNESGRKVAKRRCRHCPRNQPVHLSVPTCRVPTPIMMVWGKSRAGFWHISRRDLRSGHPLLLAANYY